MFSKPTKIAGAVMAVGLLAAACGSPAGNDGGGGGDASNEATAAAKELGIDLDSCSTDVTKKFGSTVKVGNTIPLTGPVAPALGGIGASLKAAFDLFNASSGLDTKFELVQMDDAFTPDKALTSTQTLLDKDKIDLMTTVISTAQVAAVRGVLGDECVPFVPGVSGGASANSPKEFPWTTIFSMPSTVDARIMMAAISEDNPDGAKVAVLYSNTESGKDYLKALEKYKGKNEIVKTESLEATETAAPSSQITTLRSSGADTLVAIPTSAQCASTMQEVGNQGWKVPSYLTVVCPAAAFDVAGTSADGWNIVTWVKDPSHGKFVDDPAVTDAVAALKKASPSTAVTNTTLGGFMYPQALFEAAKKASDSPLGLSRLGIMDAVTHLDFQPDLVQPGIKFTLDGLKDQVAIESGYLSQYKASDKSFTDGKLYGFEGEMTE